MIMSFNTVILIMQRDLLPMMIAPILGLFIVSLGSGFLSSLTTLQLNISNESFFVIGAISSSYFAGLTIGALFGERVILKIGYIRAYTSFAAILTVTILIQGLFFDPLGWFVLRFFSGLTTLGIYLVVESWLLVAVEPKWRGRLLAIYMIALYGSAMLGQAGLGYINSLGGETPFVIAGLLSCLSIIPVVMIPKISPLIELAEPFNPLKLVKITPTGVLGCFISGVCIAAIYALLPLYLHQIRMEMNVIGYIMACVIFGAMILQYPIGKWSDHQNKQLVLIKITLFSAVICLLIPFIRFSDVALIIALFFLGGCIFSIYPVSISHSADRTGKNNTLKMIQGMLLINSLGSTISPIIISPLMTKMGPNGFFWALTFINLLAVVFFIWRKNERIPPVPVTSFEPITPMSPSGAELRMTNELKEDK